MLPLYDFKHPRIPHKRGGANLNKIQSAIALNGHRIRPKGPKKIVVEPVGIEPTT